MLLESENTEFKVQATPDLYKEVVAFANTNGGVIYIGVNDNGETVGLPDADATYTQITNGIRDAILPDVTMFTKYELLDNNIIRITVSEGASKPYFLQSKGIKPSGVYVRQGASSAPASYEKIREMIRESSGDVFEEMRPLTQDLTFNYAKKSFSTYGVDFSAEKFTVLGITNPTDHLFTNLGLIISDQCPYTTKVAVFEDDNNTKFQDSKEFTGSILCQLEEAFAYLQLHNAAVIDGLKRIDHFDYPEEAVREALLNALVHRDYTFSGSTIINVNEKEMAFISLGGLPYDLSVEDIQTGISQPRNPKLAAVFHRLHLIESYGTGIRRIFSLYQNCSAQPTFMNAPNSFRLVLPNQNQSNLNLVPNEEERISPQKKKILDHLKQHEEITEPEIQELLHVGRTRAYEIAKELRIAGKIQVLGRGKTKRYRLE